MGSKEPEYIDVIGRPSQVDSSPTLRASTTSSHPGPSTLGGVGAEAQAGPMERGPRLEWKVLELDGHLVSYGEAGTGNTILFLHGWGVDHRSYKRALATLVAAGTHVVAPALPGFGGTDRQGSAGDSIPDFAAWICEFLDALHLHEPLVVMGHSFGGAVAISFAHGYPDRVRALVLINSVGASAWKGSGNALRSMAERPLWDWGVHLPEDLFPLRQMRRVLPVVLSEAAPNFLHDPRSFVHVARLARYADLTTELSELRDRGLPVIVLWGRRDHVVTQQSFEQMVELLGGASAITVEGGHGWLIADAERFGEVMTNVLEMLSRSDANEHTRRGESA